jgi:hypothetical protein
MKENKRRLLVHDFYVRTGICPAIGNMKKEMTQLRISLVSYLLRKGYVGDKEIGLSRLTEDLNADREQLRLAAYGAVISPVGVGVVETGLTDKGIANREMSLKVTDENNARWYVSFLKRAM